MTIAISDPDVRLLASLSASISGDYAQASNLWRGSPFEWILGCPSRQKGAIFESLVAGLCAAKGLNVTRTGDSDADRTLDEPRLVLGVLVTLHVMGLAFWTGAFAPLHRLAGSDAKAAGALAAECGAWAVRIVSALAAAGAVLFVTLAGNPAAALGTPYGRLLAVKLLLFAPLLGLAAFNRYRLTPALQTGAPRAGAHLRRSIRFEALAVLAILITTAVLTTVASPEGPESRADRQRSAITPESPA